jgi:hypothetical protein
VSTTTFYVDQRGYCPALALLHSLAFSALLLLLWLCELFELFGARALIRARRGYGAPSNLTLWRYEQEGGYGASSKEGLWWLLEQVGAVVVIRARRGCGGYSSK